MFGAQISPTEKPLLRSETPKRACPVVRFGRPDRGPVTYGNNTFVANANVASLTTGSGNDSITFNQSVANNNWNERIKTGGGNDSINIKGLLGRSWGHSGWYDCYWGENYSALTSGDGDDIITLSGGWRWRLIGWY